MILGDIINKYRIENNLSMDEFSKMSGLSKAYISMLEKNKNSSNGKPIIPSLPTLKKVATTINMSLDELMRLLDGNQMIVIPGEEKRESTAIRLKKAEEQDIQDIAVIIEKMRKRLTQGNLVFEGKPVTSENIQSILAALQIGMEMARKQMAEEEKGDT